MKVWNLNVKRGPDGSKHLDIQMHGVIDGGWMDEEGVDSAEVIGELNQHLDAKTIAVRINSVGGSAFGGVAMYNALQAHPADVRCIVEGLAASAASLVAMAGKCTMGYGAMLMIHPPMALAMGGAEDFRKTADVLDKIQDSLAAIYTQKTGKSLDEINDMLDAETWMTAEEAVAAGFADAVGNDAADGDPDADEEPDFDDPNEGNEDEPDDQQPTMTAAGISWRGVEFPLAAMPQQIVAMAKMASAAVAAAAPAAAPPALAIVPPPAPQPPITRAELALRSPELVEALVAEGHAAGVAAERARLQAIDDLGLKGCDDLVVAAKYSAAPSTAPELAVAVVKAGKQAGADLLAARRAESRALASIQTTAPDQTNAAAEARIVKAITDGGNSMRGGTTR